LALKKSPTRPALLKVIAALFVLNAIGYFAGGWEEGYLAGVRGDWLLGFTVTKPERIRVAMLLWGAC